MVFIGIIAALALLCIGYLVFASGPTEAQAQCMAANDGAECVKVTRWEPASSIRSSHE